MKIHRFNPKKEKRGLLYQVFVVVALCFTLTIVGLGSYVVVQAIIPDEKAFKVPPTTEKVEPAQKEHKVKVDRQQKKSRKLSKRIAAAQVKSVNAPEVNISIPDSMGVGQGISTISPIDMKGNMNISQATVSLMDVTTRNIDKVFIAIDSGPYLMTDKRGGMDTYKVIREDIKKLINALPSTILFNLMAFDLSGGVGMSTFQSSLVPATKMNKQMAEDWINPLNASLDRLGIQGGERYKLKYDFIPQPPNVNIYKANCYRVYQAAIEQGANAIYILTTDWTDPDDLKVPMKDIEILRYNKALDSYEESLEKQRRSQGWSDDKQAEYDSRYAKAYAQALAQARKWITNENKKRSQQGGSLYVGAASNAIRDNNFFKAPQPQPPSASAKKPVEQFKSYGKNGIIKFYAPLFKKEYIDKEMKLPVVNIIVFRGTDEDFPVEKAKAVRGFATANQGGRIRILKGLKPVGE